MNTPTTDALKVSIDLINKANKLASRRECVTRIALELLTANIENITELPIIRTDRQLKDALTDSQAFKRAQGAAIAQACREGAKNTDLAATRIIEAAIEELNLYV